MSLEGTPIPYRELEQPLEVPVLPAWHEAYKHGNRHHPQAVYGIATYVGKEIVDSLLSDETDLVSAARSRFTNEQFAELNQAVVHAHQAYGIRVMPEGAPEAGKRTFDPDYWFNGTWDDIKRCVVRSLAYVGADKHPADIEKEIDQIPVEVLNTMEGIKLEHSIRESYRASSPANNLATTIMRDRDNVENKYTQADIEEFQKSDVYQRTLPIVAKMFQISAEVLSSDEAKELARRRRNTFSKRNPSNEDDESSYNTTSQSYEFQLIRLMKEGFDPLVKQEEITNDQVYNFLTAISGNSKLYLREKLPRALPETRIKNS